MSGAGAWARRYWALIRNAWLVDFQYRAAIALWLLWGLMEPAIALGIWWGVAGTGDVGGYGRADFARIKLTVTRRFTDGVVIRWHRQQRRMPDRGKDMLSYACGGK